MLSLLLPGFGLVGVLCEGPGGLWFGGLCGDLGLGTSGNGLKLSFCKLAWLLLCLDWSRYVFSCG